MKSVTLEKLPYPYQAAFTICSDIDGTPFDRFIELQRFLNTNHPTKLGPGLSLPIGNSFWMYDHPDNDDSAFAYFSPVHKTPSSNAPIIRELIQSGILDVMHTYGNFSVKYLFSRDLAERALEELDKNDCHIRVWTNHGGKTNPQKIGGGSDGLGDVRDSGKNSFYHSDLLRQYGVQFFWESEWNLTHLVGQGRHARISEAFWKSPLQKTFLMKAKSYFKFILTEGDKILSNVTGQHALPWTISNFENDLLNIQSLRDKTQLYQFTRFGHGRFDWSDDLPYLLNNQVLETLLEMGGFLVLYIHLGDLKEGSNKILHGSTIHKLRQIADLYHSEKLWIATTSQLLIYQAVHQSLNWQVEETDMLYIVHIKGLKKESLLAELNFQGLQGLTFKAPVDKEVIVKFDQKIIPTKIILKNENQWIKIPIRKMEWPLD